MQEPDDLGLELIQPEDFLPPNPIPADAQRLGLDRWSGAEIAFAASLDGSKRSHRAVAIALLVVFLMPVFITLLSLLR
jgi:hypothetical protein